MQQTAKDLTELESLIGINFNDKNLLSVALTHRSYLNETKNATEHNERLEFLGDAVLELVATEHLYKNFNNPEGELTNWRSAVVRGDNLAKVAAQLKLGEYLKMSKGEEKSGGRTRTLLLANTLEAVIGAIHLDQGYSKAEEFINLHIVSTLDEIIENKLYLDPKSSLQEKTQSTMSKTPEYKVIAEDGPDHDKKFTVAVFAGSNKLGTGTGSSKQKAEQLAAIDALNNL